ncbi:MAG: hypothetical protein IKE46_11755 [Selenomonadaceae bacterium]|nr:hypothetical protein [Selenomonadaceae bacterium]
MKLSPKERQKVMKLLREERRPGMIIWMEPHADGDTYPNGYVQGDPFDVVMMALHAVDFAANAFGIRPEQAALNIAEMFSDKEYKPSNIQGELRIIK